MVFSGSVIILNNDFVIEISAPVLLEDLQARMEFSILAINYLSFSAKKTTTNKQHRETSKATELSRCNFTTSWDLIEKDNIDTTIWSTYIYICM